MKAIYLKLFLIFLIAGSFSLPARAQEDTSSQVYNISKPDLKKWGQDSIECVKNYSLYREYYRNYKKSKDAGKLDEAKDYIKSAVAPWRWVFNNCPVASQNIYRDGAQIIQYLYNNASDSDKPAYADTLMMVYDQRIEMYAWKESLGYILGRKAVDHFKFKKREQEKTFELFEESFERTEFGDYAPAVLYYHMVSAVNLFKSGKAEKSLIIKTYDKINTVFLKSIEEKVKNYKAFKKLKPRIDALFNPFANCKDLVTVFSKQFEENPDDTKLLKRISEILDKQGCTESDLYFNATKRLHEIEPSAESAFLMGKMALKREMNQEAAGYFKEAAESYEDSTKKNKAYYLLANVNMGNNNYPAARKNAYNALEYKPGDGRCYILIGDLYANSSSRCGENEISKKAVYWAAVDKYQKAKNADPSVAEKAQKKISTYRQYFPGQEKIFFHNLNKGQKYEVGCWINETTTVRQK